MTDGKLSGGRQRPSVSRSHKKKSLNRMNCVTNTDSFNAQQYFTNTSVRLPQIKHTLELQQSTNLAKLEYEKNKAAVNSY